MEAMRREEDLRVVVNIIEEGGEKAMANAASEEGGSLDVKGRNRGSFD